MRSQFVFLGVDTGTGSAIPKMRVVMVSMMPTAIIMPVGPGVRKYSQEAPSPCTRGATQAPLRRIDERQLTVWRVVYMSQRVSFFNTGIYLSD